MSNNSDLFDFFNKMNAGDLSHVDDMSDEEVKKLSPYVLLMWQPTDKAVRPIHTLSVAHTVPDKVFSLSKHPRLLLKLFIAANGGISRTRYAFKKQGKAEKTPEIDMIAKFYNVTHSDAAEYKEVLTKEEVAQITKFFENRE
jgi:hypothetical protein